MQGSKGPQSSKTWHVLRVTCEGFGSPHRRSVCCIMHLNELHRQAIAAVAALVMQAAGKAAHQMYTEIADLCLRERSRNGRPRNLGRIECAPVILDPSD